MKCEVEVVGMKWFDRLIVFLATSTCIKIVIVWGCCFFTVLNQRRNRQDIEIFNRLCVPQANPSWCQHSLRFLWNSSSFHSFALRILSILHVSKSIWDAIKDPFFMRNVSNLMLLLPDDQLSLFLLFFFPLKKSGNYLCFKRMVGEHEIQRDVHLD